METLSLSPFSETFTPPSKCQLSLASCNASVLIFLFCPEFVQTFSSSSQAGQKCKTCNLQTSTNPPWNECCWRRKSSFPSFKFPIYKNCLHPTVSSFHLFSCFSVFSQENIIDNLEISHFAIFSGIYQTSGNMNPTLTLKCLKGNGWKSLLKITSLQFVLFPAAPISWKELLTFHS